MPQGRSRKMTRNSGIDEIGKRRGTATCIRPAVGLHVYRSNNEKGRLRGPSISYNEFEALKLPRGLFIGL